MSHHAVKGQGVLSKADLIERAEQLVPLLKEKARACELARQPLDEVIDAVRDSGLFSMMVPQRFGGQEADIDTFFEVSLALSTADASLGWIIGFYIEHNWWFCNFPETFQEEVFADANYVLAPGALSMGGGKATVTDGGYILSGQWQWGTGIVHSTWVIAGALLDKGDGVPVPTFFVLPRSDVEMIDTWHMSGMCGTGSNDFAIHEKFVPEERALGFVDMVSPEAPVAKMYDAPIYQTPMLIVLALAAGLPSLGAAKRAVQEFCEQSQKKYNMATLQLQSENGSRQSLAAQAALTVESAELLMRSTLEEVMSKRGSASREERAAMLARISHAVALSRSAVNQLCEAAGAGANNLDNPLQRLLRDVNVASCHAIFDRDTRYRDFGRTMLGLEPESALL